MHADTERSYVLLIVPQLQGFSTQVSGKLGRHTLEIVGSGFAYKRGGCKSNAVMVGGVKCEVTSCTASSLFCTVGREPEEDICNQTTVDVDPPDSARTFSQIWADDVSVFDLLIFFFFFFSFICAYVRL